MFYLSTLTPNEFDELSFTMSPWRFAVLAACIAFVEGKPHQMPKMPGGALASWGCWKAGKRQRRARDLGGGDHEIWWDAMPISSMYGIYANIGGILMINVTVYSSTMDPMGYTTSLVGCWRYNLSSSWQVPCREWITVPDQPSFQRTWSMFDLKR